jgi:mitogen-activated protein kinase 1/3
MLTVHDEPYHDPQDEPLAKPLEPSFFDFDNGDPLGKEELKGMIFILGTQLMLLNLDRHIVLIYNEITRPDSAPSSFLQSGPA